MPSERKEKVMSTVTKHLKETALVSDLGPEPVLQITAELRKLLADTFALYFKAKNFHWHIGGPHFRDLHLLLDEQAAQILAMTDEIAERARKLGGTTLHSIGEIARYQRIRDNNDEHLTAKQMLAELRGDNQALIRFLRAAHQICEQHHDVGTNSLIEPWIDEAERRSWFLSQNLQES
jgi:starvation-inducible DNA-binding protein